MNQQINFPLNESSGILVHDKQGKIRGKAINPIWLINKSYYWNLLHSQASESTAGYNYDFNSGNFVYFNSDSLYTLDIRRNIWEGYKHQPLPMKMYLGTNFFYPDSRSVYIYEVDNHADVCTICALNVLTGEVEKVDDKFCLHSDTTILLIWILFVISSIFLEVLAHANIPIHWKYMIWIKSHGILLN